jgi:hypothetical protein
VCADLRVARARETKKKVGARYVSSLRPTIFSLFSDQFASKDIYLIWSRNFSETNINYVTEIKIFLMSTGR